MTQNPLIPIEALEGLMKKTFFDQAVAPGLFWDALLKSNLYAPLVKNADLLKTKGDLSEDEFPMALGSDKDGHTIVWLFTSPKVMAEYIEDELPYLELSAQTMMANMRNMEHDIVLIGPSRLTLLLNDELVESLADGKVPEGDDPMKMVPKDAQIMVGATKEDTSHLETRFLKLFQEKPEVLEAAFMHVSDDSGARLLLGLRLMNEDRESLKKITEIIAKAAEGVLEKGQTMDITLISGSLREAFTKWGKFFFKRDEGKK